ncbi:MAG: hypothetical protein U5P41_07155 [Gammaproteobacteria bacterium]|nr:hypothetical protein [Gammaproteobacteria bacterium]
MSNGCAAFGPISGNWSNVGNILANDGANATKDTSGDNGSAWLRSYDYGLDIPDGEPITRIEAKSEMAHSGDGAVATGFCFTGPSGQPPSSGATLNCFQESGSFSMQEFVYGIDIDGEVVASDVENSGFGVTTQRQQVFASGTVSVDFHQVRVFYGQVIDVFYLDGAAVEGERTLVAAGAVDGTEYPYRVDEDGVGWEVTRGVFADNAGNPYITRPDTPSASSNAGGQVAFSTPVLRVDLIGGLSALKECFGVA